MDFKPKNTFFDIRYKKNHGVHIYGNINNIQNYVKCIPRNSCIVGDAVFRSFNNIKTAEEFEPTHLYVSNCLKKQRIIIGNHLSCSLIKSGDLTKNKTRDSLKT